DTRACLIQWMIQVHMWMHIPTETLHVAVGLMDLYTYLRPITSQEYQLLALAVIRLAAYDRPPEITISRKRLCALAMDAYTPAQLQNMEEALEACVGNRINFPTPYTYMEHYVMGVSEFSSAKIKWAINLCKYFFDLGLCQVDLCQYSASLRCAGVLYLIRRMLGPGHSTGYRGDLCLRNPWPTLMEKYTGHKETA
ncbi:hypothetical protein FTX61_24305, partial [Nitriliruptoraceae bacterium ZYF776]|nr:hypothetical protein [Profundirhabdus halotolerans]